MDLCDFVAKICNDVMKKNANRVTLVSSNINQDWNIMSEIGPDVDTMTSHEHHRVWNHPLPDCCLLNGLFRLIKNKSCSYYWSFVRGIHRWLGDSMQKGSNNAEIFPCHDVIFNTIHVVVLTRDNLLYNKYSRSRLDLTLQWIHINRNDRLTKILSWNMLLWQTALLYDVRITLRMVIKSNFRLSAQIFARRSGLGNVDRIVCGGYSLFIHPWQFIFLLLILILCAILQPYKLSTLDTKPFQTFHQATALTSRDSITQTWFDYVRWCTNRLSVQIFLNHNGQKVFQLLWAPKIIVPIKFRVNAFNSLWPSDTIWRQRVWSTLTQVMDCCLTAPSHYMNREVQWQSYEGNFTRDTSTINC